MAGRLHNEKRKKLRKSLVLVPELWGIELGRSAYLVQMDLIIRVTHCPVSSDQLVICHTNHHCALAQDCSHRRSRVNMESMGAHFDGGARLASLEIPHTANPRLNPIPDTSHGRSIKDGP